MATIVFGFCEIFIRVLGALRFLKMLVTTVSVGVTKDGNLNLGKSEFFLA